MGGKPDGHRRPGARAGEPRLGRLLPRPRHRTAVRQDLWADEDEPGKNRVVVLSDGLWKRVYGADRGVVGKPVQLNGQSYTILGVMPEGFRAFFNSRSDIWTPLALDPKRFDPENYTNESLQLTARLKPGVSATQANAEMHAFAEQVRRLYPKAVGPRGH